MAEMTSDQGPIRPDPCSEPCRARSLLRRGPSSPLTFSGYPGSGARGRIGDVWHHGWMGRPRIGTELGTAQSSRVWAGKRQLSLLPSPGPPSPGPLVEPQSAGEGTRICPPPRCGPAAHCQAPRTALEPHLPPLAQERFPAGPRTGWAGEPARPSVGGEPGQSGRQAGLKHVPGSGPTCHSPCLLLPRDSTPRSPQVPLPTLQLQCEA